MYLVRTEVRVRGDGATQVEERLLALAEQRKGQPGTVGVTLLHSYSRPDVYTVVSRYENVEAAWAFAKSAEYAAYLKGTQPGVVVLLQREGYESIFEVTVDGAAPGTQTCETLVDAQINQGVAGAFERSRRELYELRRAHVKGFGSGRLRRSAGTPGKYLSINTYTNIEAARASEANPETSAWFREHPNTLYASTPPTIESYYVVHRVM